MHRASTFDLFVLDAYHRYVKYQESKAEGGAVPAPKLTQTEMKSMIERAKNFVIPSVKGAK